MEKHMRKRMINKQGLLGLMFLSSFFTGLSSASSDLVAGQDAPAFELLDQESKPHKLEDYNGQWLVVYFYPKADTPGCTTEACQFRDDIFQFKKLGVALLGVSTDDVKSQEEFANKYHLPFPLLSDADGTVAASYGSFTSFGPVRFAKRHTFIIDPAGKIAKIYRNVTPKTHSNQVLADLQELGAGK
jgi:peroxiredoxin Q/BCP